MIICFEITALLNIPSIMSFKSRSLVLVGLSVRLASASRFLEINHLWKLSVLKAKMRRQIQIDKGIGGHHAGSKLHVLVGDRRLSWKVKVKVRVVAATSI
jgi:hypothetical protein